MAVYLVSDIHGNYLGFKAMLNKIGYVPGDDEMIIIGDAVDRGKESMRLLNMIRNDDSMTLLKGNHEFFCEMYLKGDLDRHQWISWGGPEFVQEVDALSDDDRDDLLDYITSLDYDYELETMYGPTVLLHTGYWSGSEIKRGRQIDVVDSYLNGIRKDEFATLVSQDIHHAKKSTMKRFDRYIICGHVPTNKLTASGGYDIYTTRWYMDIDCGSGHLSEGGRLGCYRVDDGEEFYV